MVPENDMKLSERNWKNGLVRLLAGVHPRLLLLLLIVGIWAFAFREYLLFNRALVSDQFVIDTISFFFPIDYFRISTLLSGTFPFWSFQVDLGANIYPLLVDGNPFDLIYLLFGQDHFVQAMPVVMLLKFLAAGLFFQAFLERLGIDPLPAAIGALCYTFSGYMVVNSHWYHYSNYAVFAAVFLFCWERWRQEGRWLAMVLVVGLLALKAELQLFQLVCFGAVYLLYRGVRLFGWGRGLFRLSLLLALFFSLGVLIAAYEYLPNLAVLFSSSRVGGVVDRASISTLLLQAIQPESGANLLALFGRFLATDMFGAWNGYRGPENYFEFSTLAVGGLAVLLLPLSLRGAGRARQLLWLLPLTTLLVVFFPFLRQALNGFASGTFKYLSLYCGIFLLLPACLSLNRLLRRPERGPLLVVAGWGVVVMFAALLFLFSGTGMAGEPYPAVEKPVFFRALLFAAAYLLLLLSLWRWPKAALIRLLLLVLVVVEMAVVTRGTVHRLQGALDPFFVQRRQYYFDAATAAALAAVRQVDDGFYRIEKGYSDGYLNDALIQDYFGSKSYYGFVAGGIVDFYRNLSLSGQSRRLASYRYGLDKRAALQSLLQVKYFLCRSDAECAGLEGFRQLSVHDGVRVYRNEGLAPFGKVYYRRCPPERFAPLSSADKDALLLQAVVSDRPLPGIDERCRPVGQAGPEAALEGLEWDEENFAGKVTVERPGVLFFPIPFDPGWRLLINGAEAPLLRLNFGFSGALLPQAGNYRLQLAYTPPYLLASILISLAALLVAVLLWRRYPRIGCTGRLHWPAAQRPGPCAAAGDKAAITRGGRPCAQPKE